MELNPHVILIYVVIEMENDELFQQVIAAMQEQNAVLIETVENKLDEHTKVTS